MAAPGSRPRRPARPAAPPARPRARPAAERGTPCAARGRSAHAPASAARRAAATARAMSACDPSATTPTSRRWPGRRPRTWQPPSASTSSPPTSMRSRASWRRDRAYQTSGRCSIWRRPGRVLEHGAGGQPVVGDAGVPLLERDPQLEPGQVRARGSGAPRRRTPGASRPRGVKSTSSARSHARLVGVGRRQQHHDVLARRRSGSPTSRCPAWSAARRRAPASPTAASPRPRWG